MARSVVMENVVPKLDHEPERDTTPITPRMEPGRGEAMLTVELTEAEAQVVAEVIVAWGADDCPVGAIDTRMLRTASDKLTAAIDGQTAKAA